MLEFAQLRQNFQKYFEVVPAITPELTQAAYRVRHQVYCRELGWEAPRPDGMESDAYDQQSKHILMRAHGTEDFIGCVRLVRPSAEDPDKALPLELSCGNKLNSGQVRYFQPERTRLAEVSRLAVIGKYRRRKNEQSQPVAISDQDYGKIVHPRFPYIPVGLYMGMLAMARREGIDTLLLLTEPTLAIHFTRLGVRLTPIGEPIEHRGTRLPFLMQVEPTIEKMSFIVKPLFNAIAEDVERGYRALELPAKGERLLRVSSA
ncbi:MAG: PEP-CTERM/exosortase system-associated acyltransferase [Gammaproteobacteria bacterium]|nr:PEP-CTERM/exosortase system-associated acyltransferase [Gammaproteobacteria bacterium]